ncbi:MAG: ATP-binding cassette domain-containing protein, partial [Proteobacteria bacterium]|nr:ATP-binding cassette domain-containing protein [Pseudomonadota bacterium]
MNDELLLNCTDLHAGYGRVPVLRGVSIAVRPRQFVSLIGPNGAGKSTVLKAITGFARLSSGSVTFDGAPIAGMRADRLVPLGLAYVPQGRIVFGQMSVHENLEMGAMLLKDPARLPSRLELVESLFPILRERRSQLAGLLSGGEQQMLAIAR